VLFGRSFLTENHWPRLSQPRSDFRRPIGVRVALPPIDGGRATLTPRDLTPEKPGEPHLGPSFSAVPAASAPNHDNVTL